MANKEKTWSDYHENKKSNAKKRNIPYSLNKDDWLLIMKGISNGVCDYTGVLFDQAYIPTIERIDDKRGYVRGNIAVVSEQANSAKDYLDKNTVPLRFTPSVRDAYLKLIKTSEEDLKALFKKLSDKYNPDAQGTVTIINEEEDMSEKNEVVETVNEKKHLDVVVAKAYSTSCDFFNRNNICFDISFSEFKAKMKRKKCELSGVLIEDCAEGDYPVLMIVDEDKPLTVKNSVLTLRSIQKAVAEFKSSTGLDTKLALKVFTTLQKKS